VGYDVNVRLLDRLSGDNHGKSDYVKEKEAVDPKITSLYNKIKSPVMTELTMEVQGLRLRTSTRASWATCSTGTRSWWWGATTAGT